MEIRKITEHTILEFGEYLALEEKSERTIEKYLRDLHAFFRFVGEKALCKEQSIAYKQRLLDAGYAARSVNSMLAAVNKLFQWKGWNDLRVKTLKLQRQIYCPEERELTKEEYLRLVRAVELRILFCDRHGPSIVFPGGRHDGNPDGGPADPHFPGAKAAAFASPGAGEKPETAVHGRSERRILS